MPGLMREGRIIKLNLHVLAAARGIHLGLDSKSSLRLDKRFLRIWNLTNTLARILRDGADSLVGWLLEVWEKMMANSRQSKRAWGFRQFVGEEIERLQEVDRGQLPRPAGFTTRWTCRGLWRWLIEHGGLSDKIVRQTMLVNIY